MTHRLHESADAVVLAPAAPAAVGLDQTRINDLKKWMPEAKALYKPAK